MREKTAIQFFKEIKQEQNKYKLVNGLFIVRYLNVEVCILIGNFLKGDCALNDTKINKVLITSSKQFFYPKRNLTKSGLNIWKKLNIAFVEKPIKEILK